MRGPSPSPVVLLPCFEVRRNVEEVVARDAGRSLDAWSAKVALSSMTRQVLLQIRRRSTSKGARSAKEGHDVDKLAKRANI